MTRTELGRELALPLREPALLLSMVAFYGLGKLALAAGLFGLWLAIVIVPALVRYLLSVCEARIYGRAIDAPGIETFTALTSPAAIMALLWLAASAYALFYANRQFGLLPAVVSGVVLLVVLPAPLGWLGLSRSSLASLNPAVLWSLAQVIGRPYLLVPAVATGLVALAYALRSLGAPPLLVEFLALYTGFLSFSLIGAIIAASDAVHRVQEPTPDEPEPEAVLARLDRERAAVLDHAYGLFSRGNRAGGMRHLRAYLDESDFALDDAQWLFDAMLRWELHDPALHFAQHYLSRLLDANQAVTALKVLSRCGMEDERFRPADRDRERLTALLEAHGRTDLQRFVR